MPVNIETDYTLEEVEYILSMKPTGKVPLSRYSYLDFGINWVSAKKNLLCLYYYDGAKDKRGYSSLINPYFLGKVFEKKGKVRIRGIVLPHPGTLLFFSVIWFLCIFGGYFLEESFGFDCLVISMIFYLIFNYNFFKSREKIIKHLSDTFLRKT